MSKIKVVGLMKWPVANTKIKREKNNQKLKNGPKNFEKCFGILFYFVLRTYHTEKYGSTKKNVGRVLSPTSAYTKEIRIWPLAVLK